MQLYSQEEFEKILEERDEVALLSIFDNLPNENIAQLINELEDEDLYQFVFNVIPEEHQPNVFEYIDIQIQLILTEELSKQTLGYVLNEMSPDDRTNLFEELPGNKVTQLISLLSNQERQVALSLLGYPEYSVGRLMTPDMISVKSYWTVQETLNYIRKVGEDKETLNVIYVIDDNNRLLDDIKTRDLLISELDLQINELMDHSFVALYAQDDQEVAVSTFKNVNKTALPVVNHKGELLGIVTIDDVLEVAQEENTEDIQKLGGVEVLEKPYLENSIPEILRKRGGWLVILFLGEMLTASTMGIFEEEIEKAVVLALFIPLIISSGGNTGSQAATLVIRAMALGELSPKDWWRVVKREVISGILLGILLGAIGFGRIAMWSLFSDIYGQHWFLVALTVGLSLVGVVLWGTLTGSTLPLVLKRVGFDPATSSAPFVATLIDVTGLVIYFGFAILLLSGTLL
jgi:magnesium transporter